MQQCNKIDPENINMDGLTHLFLAFAGINPSNFEVSLANPAHEDLCTRLVHKNSNICEIWIALGGWAFTDVDTTKKTWSELASCSNSHQRFIASVKVFMAKYKLKGIDIDWEYPGTPERNGQPDDTKNLVSLVKEMHAAFRTMEDYVDFFGLITYDLHGAWNNSGYYGHKIAGHINISEIQNMISLLWYAKINPAKINLGLAYYGQGYTLQDPSCNWAGCQWTGLSDAGSCTMTRGVMLLQEIETLISEKGIQLQLLQKKMMKQITFGDQ
ncbi:uncharacterized protein CIMG_11964 [Coccidioides immitis RS]|uniref:chitinase n=1 Tax=Coccidioides immitis (strain RS) TaxID=246410 RepID=A0A0D8JTU4_COCIM|nr:uncharacterized protein CIMG_11964 [Coccidioides immitis RS]KJF60702.1 hypothetical protein CIMG_11964 [Coccidioides immitis RS]